MDRKIDPFRFEGFSERAFMEAVREIDSSHDSEEEKEIRFKGLKLTYLLMTCFRFDKIFTVDDLERALKYSSDLVKLRDTLELPDLFELSWNGLTYKDFVEEYSSVTQPQSESGKEHRLALLIAEEALYYLICWDSQGFMSRTSMDAVAERFDAASMVLDLRIKAETSKGGA